MQVTCRASLLPRCPFLRGAISAERLADLFSEKIDLHVLYTRVAHRGALIVFWSVLRSVSLFPSICYTEKKRRKDIETYTCTFWQQNQWEGRETVVFIFYKNWVNKKPIPLSPKDETSRRQRAKLEFFSHPPANRMYHYQNASRKGLKLSNPINHPLPMSIANHIGFNCCVLITCDQVFFFFR